MTPLIPFADLRPADAPQIREAVERVLDRGWFVLGPEVEAFEREFAAACGAPFAIGVANGTDAIALLLRAAGVGAGDEVIVPAMTAAFTALAVTSIGAVPVIVDIDPLRMTMAPAAAEAAITSRTRALVPVHLYGQAADMAALQQIASRHHLALVEDCCQAHLSTAAGIPVGTVGLGGAFSFYPTKNLGALGDGGAVVTTDRAVAERIKRLRHGGQSSRYHHEEAGINSRLDEIQAAILRERLKTLPAATARRRALARSYRAHLPAAISTLAEVDAGHVYHLFPIRVSERDQFQAALSARGIETLIHYPVALSQQKAFAPFGPGACPEAERAAAELLSLPLHPGLTDQDVLTVAAAITDLQKGRVHA